MSISVTGKLPVVLVRRTACPARQLLLCYRTAGCVFERYSYILFHTSHWSCVGQ
ncbi:MAG: hypothetical protein U5K72_07140 [Balneolaceae bacterium]|nr:hypothetical protein [Balneolaceae bacterium]